MRNLLLILLSIFSVRAMGQSGTIIINDKAGAGDLVNKHIFFNKEHGALPGYRIQLMSGTSLEKAKEAKAGFFKKYADIGATIVFEAPNYKLRVGNYVNRFDANRDLQLILVEYPSAYIVKDLINISE